MNHRDRNAHNAGFTVGYISRGYKAKAKPLDGVKLTMYIIGLTAMFMFAASLMKLV